MSTKTIFLSLLISLVSISGANATYTEVACSTDPVFDENACNQCFDWGDQSAWSHLGLLNDDWINTWDQSMWLIKWEQDEPRMISLNWAIWIQNPDGEDFWEYTPNMEDLYSEEEEAYILPAWASVDWLQSKLGYAYTLEENSANEWDSIGLLVYPIVTHYIDNWGNIDIDGDTHNECVLYKSGETWEIPKEKPKELPKTWPESILLLFLAMLLGFGVLKLTSRA